MFFSDVCPTSERRKSATYQTALLLMVQKSGDHQLIPGGIHPRWLAGFLPSTVWLDSLRESWQLSVVSSIGFLYRQRVKGRKFAKIQTIVFQPISKVCYINTWKNITKTSEYKLVTIHVSYDNICSSPGDACSKKNKPISFPSQNKTTSRPSATPGANCAQVPRE